MNIRNHKTAICLVMLLTAFVCVSAMKAQGETPQKEKKEKKEKPPYNWLNDRPDKLSGMKNLDDYILYCDTVFNRIQTYRDSIHFYRDTAFIVIFKGDTCLKHQILDEEGNPKSFSGSFKQSSEFIVTGMNILGDVALITGKDADAALDLTSNPLASLTYGKCLKAGPKIMELAYKEVKEIVNAKKAQNADIKKWKGSCKEGSTDTAMYVKVDEKDMPENIESIPVEPDNSSGPPLSDADFEEQK